MKKSFASLASMAALSLAGAGSAHAAPSGAPFIPEQYFGPTYSHNHTVEILGTDEDSTLSTPNRGGWCSGGQPSAALAVRTLDGTTKHLYIALETYDATADALSHAHLVEVDATPSGVFVPGIKPGPKNNTSFTIATQLNEFGDVAVGDQPGALIQSYSLNNPETCAGLPNQLPNLPSDWGKPDPSSTPTKVTTAPTSTPTKTSSTPTKTTTPTKTSAPTKTSTPVVVPTKTSTPGKTPAPVTSSASATATVKVTTPGGTKTNSTTAVVPVTTSVPSGGVTESATVKVPSKGETAKATVTVNPITPSVQPTSSTSAATTGPKIQTDRVSNSNESVEMGLAAAIGGLVLAGGATVATRRRR